MKNKYLRISLSFVIIILFIGTSFVSSSRNTIENEFFYNQSVQFSCNHKGIIFSDSLYEFTLYNPSNLTNICEKVGTDSDFLSCATWSNDDYIYGCQYNSGLLYGIDPETCEMWSIGGGGTGINGLSYDPITDWLYGCSSSDYLYKINPETGEQEQIGPFSSEVSYMIGLAFDAEGTLYGWDLGNDKLWIIDTETGEATEIGSLGINLVYAPSDGAFCKVDDILYISTPGAPPNYTYQLYECDKETGEGGHIGQFPQDVDVTALVIPWDNTPENNPPYVPHNPRPMNGTTGVAGPPWFICETGDPDGDNLTYDLYWGITNPPPKVLSNASTLKYNPPGEWLIFNTTYFWKVVVWDEHGASAEGPIWHFTFAPNYPPFPAKNPIPPDGAINIPVNASLSWTGWDPNGWDQLYYDVYFGLYNPPVKATYNQTSNFYDPYGPNGDLQLYKTYYWKIVTWDREGESSTSPIWTFSTGINSPPIDLIIDGPPSRWPVGVELCFNVTSTDPDGDIIKYEINWGDGATETTGFNPSGNTIEVCHTYESKGIFIIRIRAIDEYGAMSEWAEFRIEIPRNRVTFHNIFLWFLERLLLREVFYV